MQRYITLQLDRTDLESAGRNQHRSSAIPIAGIDGCLQRGCVECSTVPLRAIFADVIDASASIIIGGTIGRGLGCETMFTGKPCSQNCSDGRWRDTPEPLAPGEETTARMGLIVFQVHSSGRN